MTRYIVVSENEIVKAEMERPETHPTLSERFRNAGEWDKYNKHIASLPRIAAPGHKWELWSEVVEGKDFRLEKQFLNENDEWQGIHFFTSIWDDLKNEFRRIVAIPIQPTPEGEKVQIDKVVNDHYDKFFGDGYWEREYKKHIVTFAKQCINLLNNDNPQTP